MLGLTERAYIAYGFAPPTQWRRLRRVMRRAKRALLLLLGALFCVSALLGIFVLAYVTKRALGLDIVPGVNMLPDRLLESLIWGTG